MNSSFFFKKKKKEKRKKKKEKENRELFSRVFGPFVCFRLELEMIKFKGGGVNVNL
jgi:hypothetical protein